MCLPLHLANRYRLYDAGGRNLVTALLNLILARATPQPDGLIGPVKLARDPSRQRYGCAQPFTHSAKIDCDLALGVLCHVRVACIVAEDAAPLRHLTAVRGRYSNTSTQSRPPTGGVSVATPRLASVPALVSAPVSGLTQLACIGRAKPPISIWTAPPLGR